MLDKNKKRLIVSILLDNNSYSNKCNVIVNELIESIKKEYIYFGNIEIQEKILLTKSQIYFCKNCKTCFKTHNCILDGIDDVNIEKDIIKKSDMFILASPVYEKNVSAFIKAFLDRVGYWCHTMEMLGKKCVIVVTGKFSGIEYVSKYLYEICSYMGFNVIGVISDNYTKSKKELSSEISFIAKRISEANVIGSIDTSNYFLEQIYKRYKEIYLNVQDNSFEALYWLNSQTIETYEEFCKIINEKKVLSCFNFEDS